MMIGVEVDWATDCFFASRSWLMISWHAVFAYPGWYEQGHWDLREYLSSLDLIFEVSEVAEVSDVHFLTQAHWIDN
jgi:hypothetical protein